MTPRDFEYEGPLTNPETARAGDRRNAEALRIIEGNKLRLTGDDDFLLWFQRWAHPMLVMDFPVNNGSMLAHFMGKRQLVMQIVGEMEEAMPGFMSRLFAARDNYEAQLKAAEEK